ncbi:MAG TPA: hypothetical protein VKE41_09915, partial [Roseiflexaceae bacterium]|nr:hypothetical protein [Roseiflexaceae bacterium]
AWGPCIIIAVGLDAGEGSNVAHYEDISYRILTQDAIRTYNPFYQTTNTKFGIKSYEKGFLEGPAAPPNHPAFRKQSTELGITQRGD